MIKKYLKLTQEQKKRGVIFSSELKPSDGTIHEVLKNDIDKWQVIENLKDDKFFNNSHFTHNEIRQ